MSTPIPAVTSLESSPDPMVVWPDAVGPDTDVAGYFGQPARAFYVKNGGVLVVVAENGNQRALPVSDGGGYSIRVRSVVASGSTASGLIFLG